MQLIFSQGISEIDFTTLETTIDPETIGNRKSHPVHHKVISQILKTVKEKIKGTDYSSELSKIWVSPQGELQLNDADNSKRPSSCLIEKAYCRIDLKNIYDSKQNMAIGLHFNEHGYSLALGVNFWEHTSFTVFGDNFYSTFDEDKKTDHDTIMETLDKRLAELNVSRAWYYRLADALREISFTQNHVTYVLGDLLKLSVARNSGFCKERNPGLNQTQVSKLALVAYENREKAYIPAWEMLNWGTNLLKPGQSNLADLLNDIRSFNNFFISSYTLITPEMYSDVVEDMRASDEKNKKG